MPIKVTRTVNNDDHHASLGSKGINCTMILNLHGLSVLILHGLHQFHVRCVTNIRAGLDRRGISNLCPQLCGMLSPVCLRLFRSPALNNRVLGIWGIIVILTSLYIG